MNDTHPVAAAGVAVTGLVIIWLTDIEPLLKAIASVVTIFSAAAAGAFYCISAWYKIQDARDARKRASTTTVTVTKETK